jgi:hypothetical protein
MSSPHLSLVTQFVTKVTCRMPHRAGSAYPSRPLEFNLVYSGVHVAQTLVLCVVFCNSLLVLLSFGHCIALRFSASD